MQVRAGVSIWKHGPPLCALAALLISISGESFWIDELTSAYLAGQGGLRDWWAALTTTGSEAQMPLFAITIWLWSKLAGASEVALRFANVPWAVIGVLAIRRLLSQTGCRSAAVLLLASPLFCFYMNEARPYVATFASAAVTLTALEGLLASHREARIADWSDRLLFPVGLLLCAATSMLNLFLVPALVLYGLMSIAAGHTRADTRHEVARFVRAGALSLAVAALGLLVLAAYYVWTLAEGYGGQKQPYTLTNLGYTVYEWLGFAGLGAPRHLLRAAGPVAALRDHWPALSLGLLAWVLTALTAVLRRARIPADPIGRQAALAFVVGASALIAAAALAPASLWGRHFMFLTPLFLILLGRIWLPRTGGPVHLWRAAGFLLLLGVLFFSSGQLRYAERYRKDPYRDAIAHLRDELGPYRALPVLWAADLRALKVYGGECIAPQDTFVPPDPDHAPRVIPAAGWSAAGVRELALRYPEYILLLHRPHTFDAAGSWQEVAERPTTTLLWQRSDMRIYHVTGG
jgi:hypothetical protein